MYGLKPVPFAPNQVYRQILRGQRRSDRPVQFCDRSAVHCAAGQTQALKACAVRFDKVQTYCGQKAWITGER